MVYARTIKTDAGKNGNTQPSLTLTFEVSGMLWKRSLVMRDRETGSLWSHILGACMRGKLKGTELRILPAVMTTWKDWLNEHPETTVLDLHRTSDDYTRSFYARPDKFVLGALIAGQPRAYSFAALKEQPVLNDTHDDRPLLILYDHDSTRAALFDRRVAEGKLTFTLSEKLVLTDRETNSIWNARTGKAIAGKLEGTQLRILPSIVSYRRAWRDFHPNSSYYEGEPGTAPKKR